MAVDPNFFKEGETEFSIFYPKGYVLSVFADRAVADQAAAALRAAGVADDDVRVTTGAEVVARHSTYQDDRTLMDCVRQFFSGLYGDESSMLDDLVARAEQGQVFVLAYAPDDAATSRAAAAERVFGPVILRKYGALAVTDLD